MITVINGFPLQRASKVDRSTVHEISQVTSGTLFTKQYEVWPPDRIWVNTLRPRQNGHHFPDYIFKRIFLNENVWILVSISLKFVPVGQNDNIPALVQIMAWRRTGDKPLSEPMMVRLPTHICVTRPQWVKSCFITLILTNISAAVLLGTC